MDVDFRWLVGIFKNQKVEVLFRTKYLFKAMKNDNFNLKFLNK